jgi:hypothetical protein
VLLSEWIDKKVTDKTTRTDVRQILSSRMASKGCYLSEHTIANVDRGMRLNRYDLAKALSDITDGEVTVAELCE